MKNALMEKELKGNEFEELLHDLTSHEIVKEMQNYRQHYNCSCYDHCKKVAFYTYLYCKKHHLDYVSATRAAMVHDLFLYDWRIKSEKSPRFHGFKHPRIALCNACKYFLLNEKEKDIILKHMWPLTIALPRYKEGYVVSFADKYSTLYECFDYYKHNFKVQKLHRYAYVFLSLLIFRLV